MKKIFCAALLTVCIGLMDGPFARAGQTADALIFQTPETQKVVPNVGGEPPAMHSHGEGNKTVVASVNGVSLTLPSLIRMMDTINARQKQPAHTAEEMAALRKKALDRLIFEELAYQEAAGKGMKADPKEVDKKLEDLKAKLGGPEKFAEAITGKGMTEEEVRAEIARDNVLQRIFQQEIYDKVTVSKKEVEKTYEKEMDKYRIPAKAIVVDIVFFLDPGKDESVRKAQTVLDKLRKDRVADPHSLVPDGTFIVTDAELSDKEQPELFEYAKKIKPGEYSDIIRASDSIHILLVKEYTPENRYPVNEVKGYLQARIGSEKHLKRMHEWESELKKGADIKIMDTGEAASLLGGATGTHEQQGQ